jgi:hypothetical protein
MDFERRIGDRNVLDSFTEDFSEVVDKYAKYIVVSGFVAISTGRSRSTEDINMIIEKLSKENFVKLHNAL